MLWNYFPLKSKELAVTWCSLVPSGIWNVNWSCSGGTSLASREGQSCSGGGLLPAPWISAPGASSTCESSSPSRHPIHSHWTCPASISSELKNCHIWFHDTLVSSLEKFWSALSNYLSSVFPLQYLSHKPDWNLIGSDDVCRWRMFLSVTGIVVTRGNVTFINSTALSLPSLFLKFVMGVKVVFPLPCPHFTSVTDYSLCVSICGPHNAVLSLSNYIWKTAHHYLLKVMANSSLIFTDRWQLNRGPDTVRVWFNGFTWWQHVYLIFV